MDNDAFSQAYIDEAIDELEQTRKVKTLGSRSSNTAAYADARATTGSLTDEVRFHAFSLLFLDPNSVSVCRVRHANGGNRSSAHRQRSYP